MREINTIIIHCAYTPVSMDVGVEEIRRWHLDRGFSDIGYHRVIRRDGTVEIGRPVEKPGAHVKGHNADSIGVCLVGGMGSREKPDCNYTASQWEALERVVIELVMRYPVADIVGHRDLDSGKACPVFDVSAWWAGR